MSQSATEWAQRDQVWGAGVCLIRTLNSWKHRHFRMFRVGTCLAITLETSGVRASNGETTMNRQLAYGLALSSIMISIAGCAQTPPPHTALTEAQSRVAAAEAQGAQQVPQASLHLKMAKDSIEEARMLMNEDRNERAAVVLERARMDAELAASLATEEAMKKKANEELERVKSLQQTNNARVAASASQG